MIYIVVCICMYCFWYILHVLFCIGMYRHLICASIGRIYMYLYVSAQCKVKGLKFRVGAEG